jgi:ankyrin repeat protein
MPPKNQQDHLTGALRERKDPTGELKELALNEKLSDEELQPLVRQALEDGADVNADVEYHGATRPITRCFIVQGKVLCLEELLMKKPDLEKSAHCENTALQAAILSPISESVKVRMIRQLLFVGADIEAKSSRFIPPLMLAVIGNLSDVVKNLLLFSKKPDPERSTVFRAGTVLAVAAANGNEIITRDLIKAGANLESTRHSDEATPLLVAAERGEANTLRILLEAGANLDAKTKQQNTALHLAANNGHDEVCRILIEKGIEKDAPNEISATALELAIQAKQLNAVVVLKNAGCGWSKDMTVKRSLIRSNQISLVKVIADGSDTIHSSLISTAAISERVEILEFFLGGSVNSKFSVDVAKELLEKSQNPQIKALLRKWMNKRLGIPEVKKEEIEENEVKPKKGKKN